MTENPIPTPEENENDGLPPIFKTWNQLYMTLIFYLLGLIVLFYWFTQLFK
ncbi:hypothetical protein [Thermoflexibacter ruber]|uniref:hypothetical protein n=1 Tax=Thermoflexibacter ruber TaxID=1003 RepID=UPI0015A6E906|nr:hypothetical protein [Thermoflexibacter ruber]